MNEQPGTNPQSFKIWIDEDMTTHFTPNLYYYKVVSDVREVLAPKNLIQRIKKFLGMEYKTKVVGYEYNIEEV